MFKPLNASLGQEPVSKQEKQIGDEIWEHDHTRLSL